MHQVMTFKDQEEWDKNVAIKTDRYGSGVMRFAGRWAGLMEARVNSGEAVADCAKETSDQADTEGITGFMYGCAVSILSKCWTHGEELRRWHNIDIQIGTEGEIANESGAVLNPAILCVGVTSEKENT